MSVIHLRHIRAALQQQFNGLIDLKDYERKTEDERDHAFLTRSLAAYMILQFAKATPTQAAAAVVDGFDDNGIDAVHFDQADRIFYVGQTKWVSSGNKGPDQGSVKKLTDGFRDLIDAKFERFNEKVKERREEILKALDDPKTTFRVFLAHSAQQELGDHPQRDLDDLVREMNDPSEIVSVEVVGQKALHEMVAGQAEGDPIDLEITLRNWGSISEPHVAFYGELEGTQIVDWWGNHRTKRFARNLRNFVGSTDVNESLLSTLRDSPEKFWYFNNGITLVCKKITKKPRGGSDRALGSFVAEGVSIVNGAQTVGAIGNASLTHPDQVKQAHVGIRLVSLEECPANFLAEVTRATNTQNRIERRDFASLDPEQIRLRTEMKLDGKEYVVKRGDRDPVPEKGCGIVEATVALACAHPDLKLAVQAKREVGKLWENIEGAPYTLLFNPRLTTTRLWRCVEILRTVDQKLFVLTGTLSGRERMVGVHGNRFILHRVFRQIAADRFDDPSYDFAKAKTLARGYTGSALSALATLVGKLFPDSYLQSLFKNAAKCDRLENQLTVAQSTGTPRQRTLFDDGNE